MANKPLSSHPPDADPSSASLPVFSAQRLSVGCIYVCVSTTTKLTIYVCAPKKSKQANPQSSLSLHFSRTEQDEVKNEDQKSSRSSSFLVTPSTIYHPYIALLPLFFAARSQHHTLHIAHCTHHAHTLHKSCLLLTKKTTSHESTILVGRATSTLLFPPWYAFLPPRVSVQFCKKDSGRLPLPFLPSPLAFPCWCCFLIASSAARMPLTTPRHSMEN